MRAESETVLMQVEQLRNEGFGPLSMSVRAGQCIVISGPSGAGKTRLLRGLTDLDPTQGRVWLLGRERSEYTPRQWRRHVGLLASTTQWWADRVGDHFERFDEWELNMLGLDTEVMGWSVSRLSSGERQRLGLLRLLANRPQVLLLDEPTANLDPQTTQRVEELILRYLKQELACALWVSHSVNQRERVGDAHWSMSGGHLQQLGR